MRRHFAPFLAGFAVATAVCALVLLRFASNELQSARHAGAIDAHADIIRRIPEVFGDDYRPADGYTVFFAVKTDAAVIVERNGVKTLRRYVEARE